MPRRPRASRLKPTTPTAVVAFANGDTVARVDIEGRSVREGRCGVKYVCGERSVW